MRLEPTGAGRTEPPRGGVRTCVPRDRGGGRLRQGNETRARQSPDSGPQLLGAAIFRRVDNDDLSQEIAALGQF
jgi:hypothetical protein